MEQLLLNIARGLVEDKDAVKVVADEKNEEGVTVIGKQGRIAKAIRTVMRAAANRAGEKVAVEID